LSGKFYLINKGSRDGIRPNQPVITPDGVFGKIYSAGKTSSIVMPANHPLSAISARIAETGEQGIVEGSSEGKLYLKLIPRESQASIGMIVVTSGLGGVYPKNILVGTIKNVKEDPNRLDLVIEVGPAVDYETAAYVIVLVRASNE
jgi:rod shape-determining protein MreC